MGAFKTGLFGCIGNPSLSLIACCIAPVTIARQAAYVGDKAPLAWVFATLIGGPCIAGGTLRGLIRKQKGIDGSFVTDAVLWCFCGPCALCQEAAETGVMDDLVSPELQQMERSG